jgi:hypothetical protein
MFQSENLIDNHTPFFIEHLFYFGCPTAIWLQCNRPITGAGYIIATEIIPQLQKLYHSYRNYTAATDIIPQLTTITMYI